MSGNSNTYNRQIFSEKFFFTYKGKLTNMQHIVKLKKKKEIIIKSLSFHKI